MFRLHKRPSYNCIMQTEESTTTTEALETMHYSAQAQSTGVLDPSTIEQGAFEAAMDHQGGHGLKRQADSDDDADAETSMLEEERPKKKTRGRVKIEMKFISNKLRRYTTFSKRKTGIMKKVGLIKLMLPVLRNLISSMPNFFPSSEKKSADFLLKFPLNKLSYFISI